MEAEEEFDLTGSQVSADGFHGALAAGALERVASPDLKDEVAPKGAHVAGPALGRGGDEDELDGACIIGGGLGLMRVANPRSMGTGHAPGFIGIDAVVADGLLAFGWQVVDGGGDEVGGFEDLEVTFDVVVTLGAVDDGFGGGVPGDFLEGEGMAQEVLGQAFAASGIVRCDDFLPPIVDVEAWVFPGEEVGELLRADEFGVAQGVKEAVAEKLDGGGHGFLRHAVESAVGGEESVGGEDVEVRVEDQVVAKGVHGCHGSDATVREVKSRAEGVLEGGCGRGVRKR